jgi:hypothetical protein
MMVGYEFDMPEQSILSIHPQESVAKKRETRDTESSVECSPRFHQSPLTPWIRRTEAPMPRLLQQQRRPLMAGN